MAESDFNAEVRTLFAEDARAFLARMEVASVLLAETPALAPKAVQALKAARPFDSIEDAAQSIRGSASSVDADFLAESASCIEELARRGSQALDLMAAHAARAHAMAAFCNDATREMTAMLSLYVEEASEEASWLAMELRERSADLRNGDDTELERLAEAAGGRVPASRPRAGAQPGALSDTAATSPPAMADGRYFDNSASVPPDPLGNAEGTSYVPAEEFAFDEVAAPPPLARIFQGEARELLVALKGHVETFLRTRTVAALESIEPLLHTIKGSAASVALPYLSAQAAEAMTFVSRLQRPAMAAGDVFIEFVVVVNRLLGTVAIPPIDASLAGLQAAPALELSEVFVSEIQRALEVASSIASELASPDVSKADAMRLTSDAAKLFHRLKGSSLVVGAKMIADEAEAALLACRNLADRATRAVAIAEGCERIKALLPATASAFGFDEPLLPVAHARRHSFRPSEPPNFISDGLLAIFREEVVGLLGPLNVALTELEASPRNVVALEAAQRVFHTLKGTAAAVGHEGMSGNAASIEHSLDMALEDPLQVDASFVAKLRADAMIVLDARE